jgi:hypothetical protein
MLRCGGAVNPSGAFSGIVHGFLVVPWGCNGLGCWYLRTMWYFCVICVYSVLRFVAGGSSARTFSVESTVNCKAIGPMSQDLQHIKIPLKYGQSYFVTRNSSFPSPSPSCFATRWLLVGLQDSCGGRINGFLMSISFHHDSPCSYDHLGGEQWVRCWPQCQRRSLVASTWHLWRHCWKLVYQLVRLFVHPWSTWFLVPVKHISFCKTKCWSVLIGS